MYKRCCPDGLVSDQQGRRHDGNGAKFGCHGVTGRVQAVLAEGLPQAEGFDGDRTLVGLQPGADETVGHQPIGLGSHQFVGGNPLPEICSIDLKELTRGLAKQTDQCVGRGSLSGSSGESEKEPLKSVIQLRIAALHYGRISG